MKKVIIEKIKEGNRIIKGRGLPKGCILCLKGQKTVLFLSGTCQNPDNCYWYCPLSKERKDKEETFANEIKISSKKELLEEINKTEAKGMSITGGEPLSDKNLEKTLEYIRFVKTKIGNKFHVHLYTNSISFNKSIAEKLALAGLDEIRFHPSRENLQKIKFALNLGLDIGAEVPVIPNKEKIEDIKKLIVFLDDIGADFINLNEFEYCFPNSSSLKNRGFQLKKGTIASVVKSKEVAINLLRDLSTQVSIKMHFCPIHSKDYYQLKMRYLRRAKNIKLPYEVITEEGLLVYGQVEGNLEDLNRFKEKITSKLKIKENVNEILRFLSTYPYYYIIDNQIISLYESYQLKGYVIEMIPFRKKKYQQITEKTPTKLFKKEFGFDENKRR